MTAPDAGAAPSRDVDPVVLDVRVYGDPVAQGRPRARTFQHGGRTRVSVYDPATSRDWKRTVLAQVLPHKPAAPVDGPLRLQLEVYVRRPASYPRRITHPVRRPDLSNYLKAVEDALGGVVYWDDAQLVELMVSKTFDPAPGARIVIERLGAVVAGDSTPK